MKLWHTKNIVYFETFLILFVVFVFCLSAIESATYAFRHIGMGENFNYIFSSIICMSVSGLGLMILLMLKLHRLEQAGLDKKKMMDLLVPRVAAMEAATDGIMITDSAGTITYANMAMAFLHHYNSADEIIGKSWQALYGEQQRYIIEKDAFHALLIQWYWQGQAQGLKNDGTLFHQAVSITALEDNGKVWVVHDNTEMMDYITLADQRLAAIEAAGDGIGIVNKDNKLTYLNKALMDLHGLQPDDLDGYIGKPWENLYSNKGRRDIKETVLPVLRNEGRWQGDAPILRKDGTVIYAEMSLTLLGDGGFIGTARDISERKKAEKEKEELREQFYQAQKMEAIGRLAGGVAHDFNNILASMLGYSEFLLEDLSPDAKEHGFAGQIMKGCMQAQGLVDQILAFSRRSDSARDVIDLVEVVNETLSMLEATKPPAVTLQLQCDIDQAFVYGTAAQVGQTLMNLCVNAIDAMEEGRGTLRIKMSCKQGKDAVGPDMLASVVLDKDETLPMRIIDDGDDTLLELGRLATDNAYVCIEVSDTGSGMPRAVMEHIFEPFYTTKPVDQGTGLGLSSVHGIMAAHGGAVTVRSCEGTGTTFTLFFPVAGTAEAKDEEMPVTYSGSGRILLVEDEDHVRDMLVQMLDRLGYETDTCCDGDEAVDHLREHPDIYDLVISDYTMPRMSGADMASEIAEDFPALPVIILSGYSKRRLRSLPAEHENIKAVLHKPVRREVLSREIYMLLQQGREKKL